MTSFKKARGLLVSQLLLQAHYGYFDLKSIPEPECRSILDIRCFKGTVAIEKNRVSLYTSRAFSFSMSICGHDTNVNCPASPRVLHDSEQSFGF